MSRHRRRRGAHRVAVAVVGALLATLGASAVLDGGTVTAAPQKPPPPVATLKVVHASMQFSDGPRAKRHDARTVFSLDADLITGTEAQGELRPALRLWAAKRDYRLFMPQGTAGWVAVREDLIAGGWRTGYRQVIPATRDHGARGVIGAGFNTEVLGRISVGTWHGLTGGRTPMTPTWKQNRDLVNQVANGAKSVGRGTNVVILGADTNMRDQDVDVFFGRGLTTVWDETRRWQQTIGTHGSTIDIIATRNNDTRVTGARIRAVRDDEVYMFSDHALVIALVEVGGVR